MKNKTPFITATEIIFDISFLTIFQQEFVDLSFSMAFHWTSFMTWNKVDRNHKTILNPILSYCKISTQSNYCITHRQPYVFLKTITNLFFLFTVSWKWRDVTVKMVREGCEVCELKWSLGAKVKSLPWAILLVAAKVTMLKGITFNL